MRNVTCGTPEISQHLYTLSCISTIFIAFQRISTAACWKIHLIQFDNSPYNRVPTNKLVYNPMK